MSQKATLHMLYTCPFCWKVRGLIEHLDMDVEFVGVNGMKIKKSVAFAGDWGKVPVFTDEQGQHVVNSTPILRHIDTTYNDGKMAAQGDKERQDAWLEWTDAKMSKATVPILYGTLGSALKTTTRISKLETFGFISKRLYAWAGFPIMWGIIAKKRVKKDGRKPKQLWHDLLTEFTTAHDGQPFFGGASPDLVDFSAFGYMRSISPFPQFNLLTDHKSGMAWYKRMEATLA
ncbi:MAG: glutathione S-transferase N-terminal domain-containing protein [Candidatus Poseidonia sp.]|nr:glutathione S-transferase N-terminal domain-containing protein [Poseidonia sp.]MBL6747422.1 glutathione S-transferase N-terminal domain-containing protein [Poseidonia sp.]MBL6806680.1 glutathione S-transferase N-terminal domain-containing protein [Poseidonia sp.]MBL6886010.1 glutathione S-transferase N-terminal domain-containing protein [Poseidonia sp.]MBL6892278.1 glutathione S-transferase N-terminal domain-containing protein [Poseidonia sp.]